MARIVRFWELCQYGIKISYTHLRRKLRPGSKWYDPDFPKPIKIGMRGLGWHSDALETYVATRPEYHLPPLPKEQEYLEPPMGKLPPPLRLLPDYSNK